MSDCVAQTDQNWRRVTSAKKLEERRRLLEFPVRPAASTASACRRSCQQVSLLDPATICRVLLQASTQVSNPRAAGAVHMSSDRRAAHLLGCRETDRRSCIQHTV